MTDPSLAQLQRNFAAALTYQDHALDSHIHAGTFSAEQRLQLYRNNFIHGMQSVMQATYPRCESVVGEACFAQLARQHVLAHPLRAGDVSHYGADFDQTIINTTQIHHSVPYLSALATLEWQLDRLAQQPSLQASFPIEQLARYLESTGMQGLGQLIFHPQGQQLSSEFAVGALWNAIREQDFEHLALNHQEQCWLQRREPHGNQVIVLDNASNALLSLCIQGKPLSYADSTMLNQLQPLIAQGIFSHFTVSGRG